MEILIKKFGNYFPPLENLAHECYKFFSAAAGRILGTVHGRVKTTS